MRRRSDYRGEMFSATVSEQEVERLLTGAPAGNGALSDLAVFVEEMRIYESYVPSDQAVERVASEAARMAIASRATAATGSRISGPVRPRWLALSPRVAAAALSIVVFAGMTGVAAAADSAAPGDPLYGLDRALERIGIGAGSAGERVEEANQLLAGGQTQLALEHAAEALEGDEAAIAALHIAIDRVQAAANENSAAVQEKVGALLTYMSENIGADRGVDGREFGQGIAEIARGIAPASTPEDQSPDSGPGNQNQPDDGQPGNSNGNGNGNGNEDKGNQGSSNQGTESGNSNPPGTGSDPETQTGKGSQPGTGGNQGGGNADPPGNSGAGGNGNGPPPDSPSVTAPGRGNRP